MAISGIVRPDPGKSKILGALCALSDYRERAVVSCAFMATTSKKPSFAKLLRRTGDLAKEGEKIFRCSFEGHSSYHQFNGGR